jgi:hypothetical protein
MSVASTSPSVGGYSFYLNVVVIQSGVAPGQRDEMSIDESNAVSGGEITWKEGDDQTETNAIVSQSGISINTTPARFLMDGSKSFLESFVSSLAVTGFHDETTTGPTQKHTPIATTPDPKKFVQDGHRIMNSIGNSLTKSSRNFSKFATDFVASKTAVSRAEKAVVECIPWIMDEIGVEIDIRKRFQHGPVFVLEVDMKTCDVLELLERVMGYEPAEHYRKIRQGMQSMGMTKSLHTFDQEILPAVRKGMMSRMAEIVPEKMKLKKSNADLEIQCVALEDDEEAKWLYNFIQFMEQMK